MTLVTMNDDTHTYSLSNLARFTACPDCDLLLPKITEPPPGTKVECPRCGSELRKTKKNSVNRTLALAITGLLLYFPAIFLSLMTFTTLGMSEGGNVLDSIISFYNQDYFFVASVVLLSAVIFPFMKLSLLATVAFCIKTEKFPPVLPLFFRLYLHLDEWGMVEVYLLGIMVTIIKMYTSVDILYGPGFFSFIALVLLTMGSSTTLDRTLFWRSLEAKRDLNGKPEKRTILRRASEEGMPMRSALQAGLVLCHDCRKLLPAHNSNQEETTRCPRCSARLHPRKAGSISRTWALILTSAILFIPANTLPIMRVDFLGIPEHSTILDGIQYFFKEGSYGIGIIILTASILVPLFKMLGLLIILLTIHFKRGHYLHNKAKMFRFIEFVGRWSMLDIFVIALLGAFVNFGFFTSIRSEPGAIYFCLVVVTTMFAAITFDPRLMWDVFDGKNTNPDKREKT